MTTGSTVVELKTGAAASPKTAIGSTIQHIVPVAVIMSAIAVLTAFVTYFVMASRAIRAM